MLLLLDLVKLVKHLQRNYQAKEKKLL